MPVLASKNQALVDRKVRDVSLASMTGVPHSEDLDEKEKQARDDAAGLDQLAPSVSADGEAQTLVAAVMKKRKLYKQLTGTEVPWFPPPRQRYGAAAGVVLGSGQPSMGYAWDSSRRSWLARLH